MDQSLTTILTRIPPEQRWRAQTVPAPIVVGLIRRTSATTEEFLLINRVVDPYVGQWALVGGKWDFGEALAEAVVREVREETGLETRFVALRGVVDERVVPGTAGVKAAHFLLFLCDLTVENGVAAEQAEGEVQWFGRQEIETLHEQGAIIPSDYAMIAAFAGAAASAPVVEVEMETSLDDSGHKQTTRMTRFDRQDNT
ncbi:MAG: NUDIX domain-containing protein [Chloroflexota bacterium]